MIEANINISNNTYKNWFFFTLLYLIIDYGRPQDILSIGFLKPGMIMTLILIWFLISKGKTILFHIKQIKMIWLFIMLLAAYIPFAVNNYFAYMTTKSMFLFMPFILSTIICVNSIDRLKKSIFIYVCIMIYISVYSILHLGMGSGNYFHDENDVSLYINMWIPFCYFLFFAETEKLKRIIYAGGLFIGVAGVVNSFSRGGFVGLVSIGAVCWLYSKKKLASLIVISLLALMVYSYAGDTYWTRMNTIKDTDEGTAVERKESWKTGWKMFLDNPLGVGGNNFPVRFPEYQTDYFQKGMWGRVAHSLWFTLMPELGILGIIIYVSLLYYNLKDIIFLRNINIENNPDLKYLHALSGAFLASFAGYFSSGTFLSVLYYPHYWYITGIIVAATRIGRYLLKPEDQVSAIT